MLAHTPSTCANTQRGGFTSDLGHKISLSATQPAAQAPLWRDAVAVQGRRLVCQTTAPLAIEAEC